MNTKTFKMTPKLREQIDALIRPILKEHGTAVECDERYDHRYTSREADKEKKVAGWHAYERHLLADGHVIYVSLNTMKAAYQPKPERKDGAAYRRYQKRQRAEEKKLAKMERAEPTVSKKAIRKMVIEKVQTGKVTIDEAAKQLVEQAKVKKPKAKAVVDPLTERKSEPVEVK